MATDWTRLRAEYVTSAVTLRDLAYRHGIKPAGVMRRAANEGWDAQRKQESAKVSKAALEVSKEDRVAVLAQFNADDLKMARALRAKAAQMMAATNTPADLRALAGAIDVAQKVGRLALGATTGNTGLSAPNGGPVGVQSVHDVPDEQLAHIATSSGP